MRKPVALTLLVLAVSACDGSLEPAAAEPAPAPEPTRAARAQPEDPVEWAWERLVVLGDDGVAYREESGWAEVDVRRGPAMRETHIVPVVDGRAFAPKAKDNDWISISRAVLGGRPVVSARSESGDLPDGHSSRDTVANWDLIWCRWVDPIRFEVVDGVTQASLANAFVHEPREVLDARGPGTVPGPCPKSAVRSVSRDSTLELVPPFHDSDMEWTMAIGAPGFAWKRVTFDGLQPPSDVALERGGHLEIRVEGARPAWFPADEGLFRLRLVVPSVDVREIPLEAHRNEQLSRPLDASPYGRPATEEESRVGYFQARSKVSLVHTAVLVDEAAVFGQSVVWSGIPVGWHQVRLVWLPHKGDRSHLVAWAYVDVEAGESTQVQLSLEPPKRVPVSGTFVLPKAWGVEPAVVLRPDWHAPGWFGREEFGELGSMSVESASVQHISGTENAYRWNAHVPRGLCDFFIEDLEYRTTFDTGDDGRSDLSVVLPEPVNLTLTFKPRVGSRALPRLQPVWDGYDPADSLGVWSVHGRWSKEDEAYLFKVPAWTGRLSLWNVGLFRLPPQPFRALTAGHRSLQVSVEVGAFLTLRLLCEGEPVALESEHAMAITVHPQEPVAELDSVGWMSDAEHNVPVVRCRDSHDGLVLRGRDDGPELEAGEISVRLPAAGVYRVTIPPLPGFLPVEPFDVELKGEARLTRDFPLQRRFP